MAPPPRDHVCASPQKFGMAVPGVATITLGRRRRQLRGVALLSHLDFRDNDGEFHCLKMNVTIFDCELYDGYKGV